MESDEDPTADGTLNRRRRWLGLVVVAAAAIGAIVAGRQAALGRADKDFEARLRATDTNRD
jgi:hypothetical protein